MGNKPRSGRSRFLRWLVLVAALGLAVIGARFVFGRPSFDPDVVGRAETRMWQAYYSGNELQIGVNLIELLRTQYGLNLPEAKQIGERLAKSAMKFKAARANYEEVVLPDLTEAYREIRRAAGMSFDPERAARAELAWWVARRTPGQNSPEQVGEKIGELYVILQGSDHPSLRTAGLLRARAAAMRDSAGDNPDWVRIEQMLKESYREIGKAR